jgi:Tol biopolymer transport system component
MSDRDGNPEIYVMNADGSGQTRLTNNAAEDHYPAWSPDDTKIAFTSHRDGNYEIYVMNADGSGQTNLSNNPASESSANWSPDGSKITFTSTRDGNFEIYVMNADGSGQTNLSNNSAFDGEPAWSPDGTKIVFDSSRDGNPEIYMMNADGSGQANLSNNPASEDTPDWQPLSTTTPFASFTAKVEIKLGPDANDDKFEVKSTLTLGNGSNGIAPLTEEVRLRVGTFTTTIPAGSFMQDTKGRLKFEGVIDGVALEAVLRPLGGGLYEFKAEGENANLTGTANPVPVELKIGDDSGNITVNAEFEDD